MAKNTHLSLDERYTIQHMLETGATFRQIALKLNRDKSTISKEVKRNSEIKKTGALGFAFNDCIHRKTCDIRQKCKVLTCSRTRCNRCSRCSEACNDYIKNVCPTLRKPPYVCNRCQRRASCSIEKRFYSARYADAHYRLQLTHLREGLCISEAEKIKLDELISPLLMNGQSIHHICVNNQSEIMYSERTIYNYVDLGLFTARNIDLPRKVKFRPRKSQHDSVKVDKKCRIGRTYEDFLRYMKEHPGNPIVEIDSVIGTVGGKLLLTIHFVKAEFMLAFIRDRNTAASVTNVFNYLNDILGDDDYSKLFPVILADNGSEFSDPTSIEISPDGVVRSKLFYCNPSSPYQKGSVENNHEFIRRIIPKGKSMDELDQEKINLMMCHINSYARKNLGDRSPYEVFELFYGRHILDALGAMLIPPNEIVLKPKLLK